MGEKDIVPTWEGVELSFENAQRLLYDALIPNLSNETRGAIGEIGLEEVSKGFIMLICLIKTDETKSSLNKGNSSLRVGIEANLRKYMNVNNQEFDCNAYLKGIFKKHELKTDFLNFLGSFLTLENKEQAMNDPETTKKIYDNLNGVRPVNTKKISQNSFKKKMNMRETQKEIKKHLIVTKDEISSLTQHMKSEGFYVDYTGSSFSYPKIDKKKVLVIVKFLFSMLFAAENMYETIDSDHKFKFDKKKITNELYNLNYKTKSK